MRRTVSVASLPLLLALAVVLMGPLAPAGARAEELKLGIVHTNDTHGHLLPYRLHSQDGWSGVARRRVAIQRARAETDYHWLVLDAGDVFQGTPLSNMLTGFLDLECMNQMGYDAMCLGNHEFDFGYALIRSRLSDANFPMLCANVVDRDRGTPVATPYVILRRGDYRIGVFGLTTETLATETHPKVGEQIRVFPAIPVARYLAGYLRSVGCDVVIALAHEGYERDLKLAAAVPDIDVVVGGHSHTFLTEPTKVGNVVVTQDGCWGENLGVLKLTFDRADPSQRFALTGFGENYEPLTPDLAQDDGLTAFIGDYNQRLEVEMNKVVCSSAQDFPLDNVRTGENALADLAADALRSIAEADVAIFNGGNFRSPIDAGTVNYGELYQLLPYDNFLMKVRVSGARLREILAYAGTQYNDGGFPQVSGMRVHYVDTKLTDVTIGGAPLDDDAQYTLLVTDFVASGGDGYPLKEDPYGASFTGLEQRASFALWASQKGTLSGGTDGRVVVEWKEMQPPAAQ